MNDLPYRDPSIPVEERVDDLLGRMTLEEKAGQLTQYFYFGAFAQNFPADTDMGQLPVDAQMFLQQPKMVEAALQAGGAGSLLFVKDAANANRLQKMAIEGNRHGIPLIFGYDVIHGLRTIMPVPIAVAASWDPSVAEAGQTVAAREARAVGIHWAFAPMVDITRDPRWGRIIEGAGEDPVLGGAMAAAQVRGFQGDFGADRIIAGPKHFAGYGASQGGRDYDQVELSDSELWNIYLPPFKAAVDAGAGNIMSAYMDLNGVPAVSNRWLLHDVLREAFGFDGFVVSDANGVRNQEAQHHVRDLADAAARALAAGNDMEMCIFDPAFTRIPQAVADGQLNEQQVDEAVRRVLRVKFSFGIFENPYVDEETSLSVLGDTAHRAVSRQAAERTFVLLKNEDQALPLKADQLGSIAVIGSLAASARDTVGPWVFEQDDAETVTILDGIKARVGEGVRVEHAAGAGIPPRKFASMFDGMDGGATPTSYDPETDDDAIEAAVELAAGADVAVVVVGQPQNQIGESASTSTLSLGGKQVEQLQRIVDTATPVVVLVMSGRPLDLRVVDEVAPAILQVWYPGTRGGEAVAAALFGDVSPGGRLPFTWPRHVGQVPLNYAHTRSHMPDGQGERYWDDPSVPLYPFGHGLSYGSFSYANLSVGTGSVAVGATARVEVQVTNTSPVAADEVVQLYIHQRHGTSSRPVRELKGFERVTLAAGETRTVGFDLGPDQLRYWSAATRDWVQDASTIDVYVGGSSTADLTAVLEVTAD
ncbi:glycoside hydrolase family 3 N-terminal domain-containing protein [Aestuariimicrobium ganziense]|uniref:glycoside hydrolase family 3 N-terminal domain-containing protein n=1 Tax=Aestuariimicrobium ganziense TaxID=2773677 RepID=UPI0019453A49|nr:glycoside hydrolase family 3 N-terminal domain-containing protein [Aestuariimicrobium ganziense]